MYVHVGKQMKIMFYVTDEGTRMYSKADIDAIVKRLATLKLYPKQEPYPSERKPISRELTAREKEIVERLTREVQKEEQAKQTDNRKKITHAELEEMLRRLTQVKQPITAPQNQGAEARKVSAVEMDNILTRLMTYDSQKWPPESKPQIYAKYHKDD